MEIVFAGLNHRTAPVAVRERLAITAQELPRLLRDLTQPSNAHTPLLAEAAVLSTCNRFEVYGLAVQGELAADGLCAALAELRRLSTVDLAPYLRYGHGVEVVRHLLAVAAGLDSMILGEPQILGQVVEAYEAALGCGAAGSVLAALMREAIHCGKRARSETAISEHAASVSHAAVELARQIFGSLAEQRILLIGAGEMAEVAARNLADNGAGRILVLNRSLGRAQELARRFAGQAYGWEDLEKALGQADIVICSAAAPHAVIRPDVLRPIMARRWQRPLFVVDIAVPRNADPAIVGLPNVYLYDIDDLQAVVDGNVTQRQREVPRVEAIVEQCTAEFMAWLHSLDVASTIRDLHAAAEQVRDREVARALRRLGPLDEHQELVIRTLAQNIVGKLLHSPTVRLKELADQGQGYRSADVLRDLFGLSGPLARDGHG